MNLIIPILSIFSILILPSLSSTTCHQSCGGKHLPYPFGFSAGCKIRLNCTKSGDTVIGKFRVHSITSDCINLNIKAKCNRSLHTLHPLFGQNYAPTWRNAILLRNCKSQAGCTFPNTNVQTTFQSFNCGSNGGNMSCYSDNRTKSEFLDFDNVSRRRCQFVVSSISLLNDSDVSVSMDVQVVNLGWWIDGGCNCSPHANCTKIISPFTKKVAFRCRCRDGFVGDGYVAGTGCRKASSNCYPAKYMSGRCGGTTRVGVLAGGIVVGAVLMITLGLIVCFIQKRNNSKTRKSKNRHLFELTGVSIPIHSYKEIEKATNNFSEKLRLGTGAYGTVYAGKLENRKWVAIKRIKHSDSDSIEQFMNEIKLISSVNHPNLVKLLGYSIENDEQILVYEFMPNGTLSQHLHKEKGNGLSWQIRLEIATQTANAIAHLHFSINPPIFHRDIKSSNILLDYNFISKVADFGLSRIGISESSHISTAPQGTPGYLDPEYHQNFHLSDKSDVYSFGVVLVEIITALKVVDFSRPQKEVNLASLAIDRICKGCLDEIIDPFLDPDSDSWTLLSVHKVGELAFRCLAYDKNLRPSMAEVAAELDEIKNMVSSFLYNLNEKPLSFKHIGLERSRKSSDMVDDSMPSSAEDSLLSEESSPSSNSLLCNIIQ